MFSYFVGNVYANPNPDAAFLRYLTAPSNGAIPPGLAAAFDARLPVLRRLCLAARPSGVLVGYKDFKKDFGVGLLDLPRSVMEFQANSYHVFAFCFGTIDVISRKGAIASALALPRNQWNMFGNRVMWWRDRSTGMSLGLLYCDATDAAFPDNISAGYLRRLYAWASLYSRALSYADSEFGDSVAKRIRAGRSSRVLWQVMRNSPPQDWSFYRALSDDLLDLCPAATPASCLVRAWQGRPLPDEVVQPLLATAEKNPALLAAVDTSSYLDLSVGNYLCLLAGKETKEKGE